MGKLKGNKGNQNYPIEDANVDPETVGSVVIYCMPFHVVFSVATLGDAGIAGREAAVERHSRVGKIAGIDFSIHYSWLVVFALFSWLLADSILPSRYEGWSGATYWSMGVLGALLLFASVLVHELAHALAARALGLPVEGITLFLFGGVSSLRAESSGPKGELIVSAVGPLASLGLFAALWLVYQGVNDKTTPFAAVLWYLWFSNLALAIFNSLPAFPMDGGRMLRSAVWTLTGSLSQATRFAARAGQIIGLLITAVASSGCSMATSCRERGRH